MKTKFKFDVKEVKVSHREVTVDFGGLNGETEIEMELRELAEDGALVLKLMDKLPGVFKEIGETVVDLKHKDRLNSQKFWAFEDERDERRRKIEEEREELRHRREMDLEFEKRQTALQEQKLQGVK